METIGKILNHQYTTTMTKSSTESEPNSCQLYYCPICKKFKPRTTVEFLGQIRYVQSRCKCEIEKYEQWMRDQEEKEHKRRIQELYSIADLGSRFEECTLANFLIRPGVEKAYEEVVCWIKDYPNRGSEGLILYGVPGNGKSHLGSVIVHDMLLRGKTSIFTDVPELFKRIKATYRRGSKESEDEIIWALIECDVLVLDEIGAEYSGRKQEDDTNWAEDILFTIINGRYRRKVPTIYTTNLSLKELRKKLGDRIYDRIIGESLPIHNAATSYRREQAIKRHNERVDI